MRSSENRGQRSEIIERSAESFLIARRSTVVQNISCGKSECASGSEQFEVCRAAGPRLGCIVLYFAAHYLQVPDIRFLPPLGLALLFVLFADTLEPFLATLSGFNQSWVALAATYAVILVILFGTAKADTWFRFNSRGYEHTVGSQDFKLMNIYLRKAYPQFEDKPLNAPRVGYEKCSLYEPYGGDRVFESMPFFAGRQTMEGIHYASTAAAKFTAFIQSVYSNEIKTPRAYILSRMNAAALPAYFNLYNISELILLTKEGKESIETSPEFEKKVTFGNMTVYRYKNSDGRYVDVPRRRPLLYGGQGLGGGVLPLVPGGEAPGPPDGPFEVREGRGGPGPPRPGIDKGGRSPEPPERPPRPARVADRNRDGAPEDPFHHEQGGRPAPRQGVLFPELEGGRGERGLPGQPAPHDGDPEAADRDADLRQKPLGGGWELDHGVDAVVPDRSERRSRPDVGNAEDRKGRKMEEVFTASQTQRAQRVRMFFV